MQGMGQRLRGAGLHLQCETILLKLLVPQMSILLLYPPGPPGTEVGLGLASIGILAASCEVWWKGSLQSLRPTSLALGRHEEGGLALAKGLSQCGPFLFL